MSEELTSDQRWQLYEQLPEDLKDAIFSGRTADINWDLSLKYDIDKISTFASLVGEVLLGILPPDKFEREIRNKLGLKPEISEALSRDVERLIFAPVSQSLDRLYGKKGSQPEITSGAKSGQDAAKGKGYEHYLKAKTLFIKANGEEFDDQILFHANLALELGLSPSKEAMLRLVRKGVYMRKERFLEAEVEIKRALELDRKLIESFSYATTYKDLSHIYEKRGQMSRAIEILEKAIAEFGTLYNPDEEGKVMAILYSELGATYLRHRSKLASADEQCFLNLQKALEVAPKYPDTYAYLGVLHGSKEIAKFYDPQKAIEYYERHLALTPPDDPKRRISEENLALLKEETTAKPKKWWTALRRLFS